MLPESHVALGRKRFDRIAQRLRADNSATFLDVALASTVLSREIAAKAPFYRRIRVRSVASRKISASGYSSEIQTSKAVGSLSRQAASEAARDVRKDNVSVGLQEWHVPMRCYAWGCGTEGQLGCGTVAGLPAFERASRPLLVNFGFSEANSATTPHGSDSVDITPIRVTCGDGCTAIIDNKRHLYTCGSGWLGHRDHASKGVDRVRIPTRIATLGTAAIAGACSFPFHISFTRVINFKEVDSDRPQFIISFKLHTHAMQHLLTVDLCTAEVAFGGGFVIACSIDGTVW